MPYIARIYNNSLLDCSLPHILNVIKTCADLENKEELHLLNTEIFKAYCLLKKTFANFYDLSEINFTWQRWHALLSPNSFYANQLIMSKVLREYLIASIKPSSNKNELSAFNEMHLLAKLKNKPDCSLDHSELMYAYFLKLGITLDVQSTRLLNTSFTLDRSCPQLETHLLIYINDDKGYDLHQQGNDQAAVFSVYRNEVISLPGELVIAHELLFTEMNSIVKEVEHCYEGQLSRYVRKKYVSILNPDYLFPKRQEEKTLDCSDSGLRCIFKGDFAVWNALYADQWPTIIRYLTTCYSSAPNQTIYLTEQSVEGLCRLLEFLTLQNPVLKHPEIREKLIHEDKWKLLSILRRVKPQYLVEERFYSTIFRDWDKPQCLGARMTLLHWFTRDTIRPTTLFYNRSSEFSLIPLIFEHKSPELLVSVLKKLQPCPPTKEHSASLVRMDNFSLQALQEIRTHLQVEFIGFAELTSILEDGPLLYLQQLKESATQEEGRRSAADSETEPPNSKGCCIVC